MEVEQGYISKAIDSFIGNSEKGGIYLEDVFTAILKPLGKMSEISEVITMWYDHKYWHEDAFKLMQELKDAGYHIAIMTNNWGNMGERLRNIKGVEIVEKIYESAIIGKRKPDLEFYEYLRADLQVNPPELFLIDDLKVNCDGAINAGWQSFIYDMSMDRGVTANNILRKELL